jgi:hypothetical protein
LIREKKKLQEAKEREKQNTLEMLKLQQEHNYERVFLKKKELEDLNKQKEELLQKKKKM